MIAAPDDIDFKSLIGPVARHLLGEPNSRLSSRSTLRFGSHGSIAVELSGEKAGTFFDHEAGVGGGTLALIEHKTKRANGEAVAWLREHRFISDDKGKPADQPRIVATYDYQNADGELLFQVVRLSPKTFRQRRPDGHGGWTWRLGDTARVLYHLPELLQATPAATVFIAEGEKDADALRDRLLVATTNPGGAGKWRPEYNDALRGRHVCILPDNDEPGLQHAQQIAQHLHDVAASVRILALPDLPPKGDVSDWLAAGGTAEDLERLAREAPAIEDGAAEHVDAAGDAQTFGRLRIVSAAACATIDARPYLLKGIIGRGDHAILIGQPTAGKSVLAPHLGYAMAQGRSVFGRRVRPCRVLYVAAEDGHGMRRRIAALARRWGPAPNLFVLPQSIDLLTMNGTDRRDLAAAVAAIEPDLVVIDTVSRAFPGLIENDAGPMGDVVRVVRSITGDGARAVITVHHVTKDGGGSPRGHGVLAADADVILMVEGSGTEARTARLTKNRNGSCDLTLSFLIETETLGTDEDGDAITAPVAAEADVTPNAGLKAREAKLTDRVAALLTEVRNALIDAGTLASPCPSDPPRRCVHRDLLRARLVANGWFSEEMLRDASQGAPKLERRAYASEHHALTALKRRGFIGFDRNLVWAFP